MTTRAPTPQMPAPGGRSARWWAVLACVACLAAHVWLVSAGRWTVWPQYTARYAELSAAFAAGQTSLLARPDPRLLALTDPYEPTANRAFRAGTGIHDHCLYDGRFYLYWGPVPALLLLPVRAIAGEGVRAGDEVLCFAFAQGLIAVTAALLVRARARYFPSSPAWLPAVGVAVAGLSAPVACTMTRPAVYEAAILGGQFFLLAGILLAWRTLDARPWRTHDNDSPAKPVRGGLALSAAGACLAAAVGCRVSLAVAVVGVGLLVCGRIARAHATRPARAAALLLAFGLPLAAAAVALGWYNHARFGAWHEFGQRYQLGGANLRSYPGLFGIANLWPGLWSYFLRPVAVTPQFPFLLAMPGDGTFPAFVTRPPHYESFDPITGLLWVMPFLGLLAIPLVGLFRRADTAGPRPTWLVATLVTAAVLGFAPVLLMIGSSQRYLVDLTPPLVIVATLSFCAVSADGPSDRRRRGRRRLVTGVAAAAVTAAAGLLVSIEGYSGHFRLHNPALFPARSSGTPPTDAPPVVRRERVARSP